MMRGEFFTVESVTPRKVSKSHEEEGDANGVPRQPKASRVVVKAQAVAADHLSSES